MGGRRAMLGAGPARPAHMRPPAARRRTKTTATATAIVGLLASLLIPANVGAGVPGQTNPILDLLEAAAAVSGQQVVVEGDVVTLTDPEGDQEGFQDPAGDIRGGWIYDMPMVPGYLLEAGAPFGCDTVVLCSPRGVAEPQAFDGGAWLIVMQLGGPLSALDPARRWEAGAFLSLVEYPTTPVQPGNLIGGYSHLIVARQQGSMRGVFEYGVGTGSFEEFQTRTRVRTEMDYVGLLIARETDLPRMPSAWGLYAFSSDNTQAGTGRDVLGAIGDAPTPIGTPPVLEFQAAPTAPPVTAPPVATALPTAAETAGPVPTQVGPATPTGTSFDPPWVALIVLGGLLALIGLFLLWRGRRAQPVSVAPDPGGPAAGGGVPVGGGAVAIAATPGDPCPPLLEAARRARAACDEATRAAAAAADAARERAAEAETANRARDDARKAREAAEQEVARRQEEPDRASWMSSGDRYEDSYDLKLKADARAAANAAHSDAVANATSDAQRGQAHRDWQEQLEHIDSQEGLDELRKNDKEGRAKWVKEAQEALDAAREAEARAEEAANRASEAARTAADAAAEAQRRADAACAEAEAAEQAAIDAGCMGAKGGPATPAPAPSPQPDPEPDPAPPAPPTPPGGGTPPPAGPTPPPGGGGPPPTPPTTPPPPVGGGGETPSKPRQCEDGAEEWRRESAPVGAFLVPVPGEKIQISASPSFANLDEYLEGWKPYDADSKQVEDGSPGVPPSAFRRADDSRWRQLFDGVDRKAMHVEIEVRLPLQLVRVHCERLYQCRNGAWVRTNRCRAVQHEPELKPKSMRFERDAAKTNEIVVFGRQCVAEWVKAEAQQLELDSFRTTCCR